MVSGTYLAKSPRRSFAHFPKVAIGPGFTSPAGLLHLKETTNAVAIILENPSTGATALSTLTLNEDISTKGMNFRYINASDTAGTWFQLANSGTIFTRSGATAGFLIGALAGQIRFLVGGTGVIADEERMSIDATEGVAMTHRFSTEPFTPSQITANQDDYDPGDTAFVRLSTDASRDITGVTGGTDGRLLTAINVGSFDVVLKHQDVLSTAANRFLNNTGADITLGPNAGADMHYDAADSRWRVFKK